MDDVWALGVTNLTFLREYDRMAAEHASLVGRDLEPWRSVLAVALWLQENHGVDGLFMRMLRLSETYQVERSDLEAGDQVRVAVKALDEMTSKLPTPDSPYTFEPGLLASAMNLIAVEEGLTEDAEGEKKFTNAKRVGWMLKRLRFDKEIPGRNKRWKTTRAEVDALGRAYGIPVKMTKTDPARNGVPDAAVDVATF